MSKPRNATELLEEAEKLLKIAHSALWRMRLHGHGSDCSLSHEVRMFALHFSNESRDGPGALQINGNGRYREWRKSAQAFFDKQEKS